jgi:cell wall-associated NlpC family hydrolase
MKKLALAVLCSCLLIALGARANALQSRPAAGAASNSWLKMKAIIEGYLGRPYVWGAAGLKSFDCSGLVWRVMSDSGIMIKRTTARKLYMCLPKPGPGEAWDQGNIVFFDDLKHCGIVADRKSFYHAQTGTGTTLSRFAPFWVFKIVGFRRIPQREAR